MKVTELVISFPPNESIPTQFELFLTGQIGQIGSRKYLISRTATILFLRSKLSPILHHIKTAKFIAFTRIRQSI